MRQILYLGPTPYDEQCVGAGQPGEYQECVRYRELLQTLFPDYEKHGCKFRINRANHDLGEYQEVVIEYDSDNDDSVVFAFLVENNLPDKWDSATILATFVRTGNWDHLKGYKYPENDPYL